ncbi:hypothetical protein HY992_02255 [Candidatus Micrarchaeota archaeon]|nr:hypothetical protein [Candidatus Micrarchaeota archaeon]
MALLDRLSRLLELLSTVKSFKFSFEDEVLLKRQFTTRLVRGSEIPTLIASEDDEFNQESHLKYAMREASVPKIRCNYCGEEKPAHCIVYNHDYAVCLDCDRPSSTGNYPWGSILQ